MTTGDASRDGNGNYVRLALAITANTTVPDADASSSGDPYLTVSFDDEEVYRSEPLPRAPDHTLRVPLTDDIRSHGSGPVTLTVTLWDADVVSDDRIRTASKDVVFGRVTTETPTEAAEMTSSPNVSTATEKTAAETDDGDRPANRVDSRGRSDRRRRYVRSAVPRRTH